METKIQFDVFDKDGTKQIWWSGPLTRGASNGHFVTWWKGNDSTIFKSNSMACLLDECDIRLHDITLDVYKELQDVRLRVVEWQIANGLILQCSRMCKCNLVVICN